MAFPIVRDPNQIPANVLFPEDYEASKTMIVKDFAIIGCFIVGAIVGCAFFFTQ